MENNEKNEAYVIVVETGMSHECYLGENDVVVSKIHGARMYHDEIYIKSDLQRIISKYKNKQCAWLNDEKNLSIKKIVILDGNKNYQIIEPDDHYISVMYPDMKNLNIACEKVMFGIQNTTTKFLTDEEEKTLISLTKKWSNSYNKYKDEVIKQIKDNIE